MGKKLRSEAKPSATLVLTESREKACSGGIVPSEVRDVSAGQWEDRREMRRKTLTGLVWAVRVPKRTEDTPRLGFKGSWEPKAVF